MAVTAKEKRIKNGAVLKETETDSFGSAIHHKVKKLNDSTYLYYSGSDSWETPDKTDWEARAVVNLNGSIDCFDGLRIGYKENLALNQALIKILREYPSVQFAGKSTVYDPDHGSHDLSFKTEKGKVKIRRDPHCESFAFSLFEIVEPFEEISMAEKNALKDSDVTNEFVKHQELIDRCLHNAGYEFNNINEDGTINVICSPVQVL